jgi:hypothetical protein
VGVEVIYFPFTVHTSSSQLRRALGLVTEPEHVVTPAGLVNSSTRLFRTEPQRGIT